MQAYFGVITILLFIVMVIVRTLSLRKQGIEAMDFGKKDKKDFIVLPFALFYFYLIAANAFHLQTIWGQNLFYVKELSWAGVLICLAALVFFTWTMISFRKSFRVGLVANIEQGLVTTGAFSISRNPVYVSFVMMLIAQFLIFPVWILLIYIGVAAMRFHKQVLKEEQFLLEQYGQEFMTYRGKVRRYL